MSVKGKKLGTGIKKYVALDLHISPQEKYGMRYLLQRSQVSPAVQTAPPGLKSKCILLPSCPTPYRFPGH